MKKAIVTYDYRTLLFKSVQNAVEFMELLSVAEVVEKKYVDNIAIYSPGNKNSRQIITTMDFVDASFIRDLNPEEKENEEIISLKNKLEWKDADIKILNDKIKVLECEKSELMKSIDS
jgi:predicted nuclease with TOPRIM domain